MKTSVCITLSAKSETEVTSFTIESNLARFTIVSEM